MVGNLNSIVNRNAVLVDTTGETYKNKSVLQKAVYLYKGEANALLKIDQVDDDFNFIHKKNEIINNNISNILDELIKYGTIIPQNSDYNLLIDYLDQGYIDIKEIKDSIIYFLKNKSNYIYIKANMPLTSGINGETIIIQDFHNLDHDLKRSEQSILAYGIKNDFFNNFNIYILKLLAKRGGDTLDEFCYMYYDENLLNKYIQKLGINI